MVGCLKQQFKQYKQRFKRAVLLVLFVPLSGLGNDNDDVLIIEGTRITGNQESPTILYVVPWQAPSIEGLDSAGSIPEVDRSIKPLKRSEFNRLIDYHQHFKNVNYSETPADSTQNTKQ